MHVLKSLSACDHPQYNTAALISTCILSLVSCSTLDDGVDDELVASNVVWMSWGLFWVNLICFIPVTQSLPDCFYPALYAFGDSLTDVGNAIAAFPDQFKHAEIAPNGFQFPMHAADRLCDGKLLVDFMAFGIRRRPNYAILRGTAADFTYGSNFAVSGASARTSKEWVKNSGFSTPFSLEVQVQWLYRYKVRLLFYENQTYVVQSLPKSSTLNSSLYMVYAGYQDYFFSLYDEILTPTQTLNIVSDVVSAIVSAIESIIAFGARDILVVNLPPLGCTPAMLTLYGNSSSAAYDDHGCLSDLNEITTTHNEALGDQMVKLRNEYPALNLFYGDLHGVYTDILDNPVDYNVTEPLTSCCGQGGSYNFDKNYFCGWNYADNVTTITMPPCANSFNHLSWDGIHTSNTLNAAAAKAFLSGEYITPVGGFNCSPDFTAWPSQT